jgi:putative DNA primase/helicase
MNNPHKDNSMNSITDTNNNATLTIKEVEQRLKEANAKLKKIETNCANWEYEAGNASDKIKEQQEKEKKAKEKNKVKIETEIKKLKTKLRKFKKDLREAKKDKILLKQTISNLEEAKKELQKNKPEAPTQVNNNAIVIDPEFDYCEVTGRKREFYAKNIKRDIKKVLNHPNYKEATEENYNLIITTLVHMVNKAYTRVTVDTDTYILGYKKRRKRQGLVMTLYSLPEFKKLLSNVPMVVSEFKETMVEIKPNYKSIAEIWFDHPEANDAYNGIDLQPDLTACGIEDGYLNIWQGFGVTDLTASKDDEQLTIYLNHIKDIICDGNEEYYNELIRFLAHMRQYPEVKAQYAIVLESEEHGTGKSTFLQPLLTMCGMHGAEIQKGERVFGKFNSRLANLIFVVLEEAFAGSQDATNALKNIITSYILELEQKGKDVIELENYIRLILTTNQKDILKIDPTERRYFYLKVSAERLEDDEYFKTLHFAHPKDKEHLRFTSKLSFYLNNYQLPDGYIPKNPPKTKTLGMKKLDNLSPEHQFIYRILYSGSNTSIHAPINWQTRLTNKELEDRYNDFKRSLKKRCLDKETSNPMQRIGKTLNRIGILDARIAGGRGKEMLEDLLPEYKQKFTEILKLPKDVF